MIGRVELWILNLREKLIKWLSLTDKERIIKGLLEIIYSEDE